METSSIGDLIREKSVDPFGFEELVDAWNACFTDETTQPPAIQSAAFDAAVGDSLNALASESASDIVGSQIRRMVAAFNHPALVCGSDGLIVTMNKIGLERLNAMPGMSVDTMGYAPIGGRSLTAEINAAQDRRNSVVGEPVLLRAQSDGDDRLATLILIPISASQTQRPSTLVFVVNPGWREDIAPILARSFDLTSSESAILTGFLDGKSLVDIAQERFRSVATVRTQFQAIMAKTGARTQSEVMRNMLAFSQFMGDIDKITDVAKHPFRKRADMMRPCSRGSHRALMKLPSTLSGLPRIGPTGWSDVRGL